MTLTDRINRTGQYKHARTVETVRALADSISSAWTGEASDTVRCAHCGELIGYGETVWRQTHDGIWYAICADLADCADRAHGRLS